MGNLLSQHKQVEQKNKKPAVSDKVRERYLQ